MRSMSGIGLPVGASWPDDFAPALRPNRGPFSSALPEMQWYTAPSSCQKSTYRDAQAPVPIPGLTRFRITASGKLTN